MFVAAGSARVGAASTAMIATVLTGDGTAAAKRRFTALTAVAIVLIYKTAALLAGHPVPVVQLDVGTASAVGVEHLRDQQEEIIQAAFGQRGLDG